MPSQDASEWMWAEACELLERADRLQREFFRPHFPRGPAPTWEPPVDIFESDDTLWVLVTLPGVAPDQIGVGMEEGLLSVVGERSLNLPSATAAISRIEIPHGRFERHIELPPGAFEFDRQELENGCLLISLRKLP